MKKKIKTECLYYKELIENHGNNKKVDNDEINKAIVFLDVLTGMSFSVIEIKENANEIVDFLETIQSSIAKFRQLF